MYKTCIENTDNLNVNGLSQNLVVYKQWRLALKRMSRNLGVSTSVGRRPQIETETVS